MEQIKTEVLQFRCPCCQKLYSVDQELVQSAQPVFECRSCTSSFDFLKENVFFNEVKGVHWVETKLIRPPSIDAKLEVNNENLNCPKCNEITPKAWETCKKCGVLLARLADLDLKSEVRALPSLMSSWKLLLEKFEVASEHERFHAKCWELNSIDFGLSQYNNLRAAVVSEDLRKVIDENKSKLTTGRFQQMNQPLAEKRSFFYQFPWARFSKVLVLSMSLTLVVLGLVEPQLKNLIGVGTALTFLVIGFIIVIRGRFNPTDLWD